jgi:hypothetical protein
MFRKSSYFAIVLSATAIASATTPAAAFSSQYLGGASNHLVTEFHPATAATRVQSSLEAPHVLTPVGPPKPMPAAPGLSHPVGSTQFPIYKYPSAGSTMKNAEVPQSELPKLGIGDICLTHPNFYICRKKSGGGDGGSGGGSSGSNGNSGNPSGNGGVVVVVPQLPVQMPVAVPYGAPARVATGTGYVAPARAQPVITPACVTAADIPALAAGIDQLMPTAHLSESDMTRLNAMRESIQELATVGKVADARDVEEIAMNLLGYQKVLLRCGQGTFDWEPLAASTQAAVQAE